MALVSVAASTKSRRPKAFAIRSFPPRCGPTAASAASSTSAASAASAAPKPANATLLPDPKPPPTPGAAPPLVPTSCGPGSATASNKPNIFKRPITFATRSFPKGCGPLDFNGSLLSKERRVSTVRSFPAGCRPDGSDSKNQIEEMVKDFRNNVRKMREEGNRSGAIEGNAVHGKLLVKRKYSPMADDLNGGRNQGGQHVEVRGDRLIVQALMAAKNCPWSQCRGKGSIGLQYRKKASGVKERRNSAKG